MRSVGMEKRQWVKAVGVCAFAAQLVGGAGPSRADNACFPQPRFVYGGDPQLDSLTPDNLTRWTGSYGFGWNSGSLSEISYEGSLTDNPNYPVAANPEIGPQQLMLSFNRQIPISTVDGAEGMRLGFNYDYLDHANATHTASEIIVINFDAGGHTSTWNPTPPACTAGTLQGTECANDPNGDPAQFISLKPGYVALLRKIDDGATSTWPAPGGGGDYTQWVKDNARVWIFGDSSTGVTQYYWRMQIALPVHGKSGGVAPDPNSTPWSSPSIYLDDNMFVTTAAKVTPKFWIDFITTFSDVAAVTYHPYPDSADLNDPTQRTSDAFSIPSTTLWGSSEIGSPRDPALLAAGELHCSGTGLTIEASTADNVVWHSDIWNVKAGSNTAGLFNDGGRLLMVDSTGALAHNQMAVQVKNSGPAVDSRAINAQFLVAPYGSQAVGTVWAPLSVGGNDFKCSGKSGTRNGSCQPQPVGTTAVIDSQSTTTGPLTQGSSVELDQTQDWVPSADYMCAVQTTDTPPYNWYYQSPAESAICASAVYTPDKADGTIPLEAGLPGHQCIQAQLSATSSDVQFATKSAFRNMHQAAASLHRETATIDTRGLKRIAGQGYHEIYLYVEKLNMPYRVDAGYSPTTYNLAMQVYNRANRGNCDGEFCQPNPGFDPTVPAPSENFFAKLMPTFVVHAFADTGAKYTVNGRTIPVMTQLTSFGQFVSHDSSTEGPVFGWDAGLEPVAGTQFQKVGPNTYRIRIPNDGAGQVITHVEPLPTKRPSCSGTVNMNIVQLLTAIAPLITISPEDAGEINWLIDSLQIQCVDLQWFLNRIAAKNWGQWTSWVKLLVSEIEAASGCTCH